MNWHNLTDTAQIEEIKEDSKDRPVLVFKHSTRCSISSMALNRLERKWNDSEMDGLMPYYLDLVRYREVSNEVAQAFGIAHESPQVLLISNGECVYHTSHTGISYPDLKGKFDSLPG
ncbi:bacillithiol system redox-active protein YtxJ [Roseivirga sp. BDSF3-8]|uniref:bacillithiol system redox-active protein YtxJ n=1 Tax=Roseivirga sp. BDSF3-8 TaxID=3241598 RepID=UPI0035325D7E